tara:strand:- start:642 stop:1433 length:792 start_codon:yes stop_codon:yes gene_type:complete
MSKEALLNVNLLAARKGAAELEFAVKKVHSLDSSKGGSKGYLEAIEKRVEKLVFEEIEKFYPEDNLESPHKGYEEKNSTVTWMLKPIDGKINFINGYPHFSISLCSKIHNEIISSVVIDPIRREEFTASLGGGANLNNNKIRTSKQNGLDYAMLSYSKPKKASKIYDFDKTFKELGNQNTEMRESGCLSLDLAYVGTGRLDGLWAFDVNYIDFVSGALIAQEGGALLSNFSGDPKILNEDNILCSTSKVYKSILKSVKPYYSP